MLHEFITAQRSEIVARCRAKISSRPAPRATDLELEHGVPLFLDQLTATLQLASQGTEAIRASATKHGHDLLRRGVTVAQVVQDYGGIGQAIAELVRETDAPITTEEFQTLNACLDEAVACAVTEYGRLREHEGTERLGRLAHELRNHLNSGLLSYEMLKTGSVGIDSSTGKVLARSLMGLRNLIDRELAEVRLGAGMYQRESIMVSDLLADLEVPAAMEANARNLELSVIRIATDVKIHADRSILEAVLSNLLQNAFKFTKPRTHVVLRTRATADRVLFEIEDQCGGLPAGKAEDLFRPFEQRSPDRKGLGLGLEICARGVKVNDGLIHVRDQPGMGCIFTVDLPRG
ncbi:MAG: HAMP domain-containing histidine kinase [Deltaproteobacteria bacterium]|nr:HAMP domain-containing histidine kinase [Deltaproteobacteria bacterium]